MKAGSSPDKAGACNGEDAGFECDGEGADGAAAERLEARIRERGKDLPPPSLGLS